MKFYKLFWIFFFFTYNSLIFKTILSQHLIFSNFHNSSAHVSTEAQTIQSLLDKIRKWSTSFSSPVMRRGKIEVEDNKKDEGQET